MGALLGKLRDWLKNLWPRFEKFWFGEWFDSHQSFLKLPAFWGPFLIITAIAGIAFLKVKVDHDLVFDMAGDIDQWYKWFQVPIWIFALIIPVIGLFNANHKSEQARASMELTKAQNNFANYYKHLEEFSKYVGIISKDFDPYVKVQIKALHSKLFPQADEGNYSVFVGEGSALHAAYEMVRLTMKDIQQIKKECDESTLNVKATELLRHQTNYSYFFKDYFVFSELTPDGVFVSDNDHETFICLISEHEIRQINQNFVMLKLIEEIASFDAKTKLPNTEFIFHYKNAFNALRGSSFGGDLTSIHSKS